LIGSGTGSYKWLYEFASCHEESSPLSKDREKTVHTAADCAADCQLEQGSRIFSWSEFAPNSFDGRSNRCFCFQENAKMCSLKQSCCPNENCKDLYADDENAAKRCRIKKLPEGKIGYILQSIQEKLTDLPCPAVNTFITSSVPSVSHVKTNLVKDCFQVCFQTETCENVVYEQKTKKCYMLGGVITSVQQKKGWVAGNKSCARKIKKAPSSAFWDLEIYV